MGRIAYTVGGAATATVTFIGSLSLGFLISRKCNPDGDAADVPPAAARIEIYDGLASKYDSKIDSDETVMGIWLLRRWLAGQATGNVLEVATGTGRNHKYYKDCATLTLTDASKPMLETAVATSKQRDLTVPIAKAVKTKAEHLSSALGGQQFDTVVDTFGLCSFEDPASALAEMQKCCKPGGKVLLLEHGRSSWDWLNRILDEGASKHAAQWGCVWNRDIRALVENSGLKVVSISTYHFGTTYYVVATPSTDEPSSATKTEERDPEDQIPNVGVNKEKGSGQARGGEVVTSSAIASALSSMMVPLCVPWLSCSCGRCGCR